MQKYDLSPINDELKKAIAGAENNLQVELENLINKFSEYQDEVIKMANLSVLTDNELEKLRLSLGHFTKAFELIKQILLSGGTDYDKIQMLLKTVETAK